MAGRGNAHLCKCRRLSSRHDDRPRRWRLPDQQPRHDPSNNAVNGRACGPNSTPKKAATGLRICSGLMGGNLRTITRNLQLHLSVQPIVSAHSLGHFRSGQVAKCSSRISREIPSARRFPGRTRPAKSYNIQSGVFSEYPDSPPQSPSDVYEESSPRFRDTASFTTTLTPCRSFSLLQSITTPVATTVALGSGD